MISVITTAGDFRVAEANVDPSSKRFTLFDESGNYLLEIKNPFGDYDRGFDEKRYEIILFHRENWPEAQLWTIQEAGRDIGHIFSLSALSSGHQCIRNDRYARQGASVALKGLCSGNTFNAAHTKLCSLGEVLDIDRLYEDNLVVAIISHDRVRMVGCEIHDWNQYIADRRPVFSSVGLHLESEVSDRKRFDDASVITAEAIAKNVQLRGINGLLPATAREFLHEVVLSVVPFQEHPAFRFFLCYQMIEVLLEDINTRVLNSFAAAAKDQTPTQMRKSIKELNVRLTEADRIGRLLNANHGPMITRLGKAANIILKASGQGTEEDMASAIYSLRNMLFHNFKAANSNDSAIGRASEDFFQMLCELSLSYQVPIVEM